MCDIVIPQLAEAQGPIRFGEDFELDLAARRLRRGSHPLKLERIPLEILVVLLEHRGEIVTREELVAKVWGTSVFLDTDNSIRGAVRKIRRVLKDDPEFPRFIQTVTGQGYRFIAPIERVLEPSATPVSRPPLVPAPGRPPWRRAWVLAVVLAAFMGAIFAFNFAGIRNRVFARGVAPIHSIAVLPLRNLSGDPAQDYLADGITDALITDLAQISSLRVISRTSAMHYKGSQQALPEIARELNVDAVVEGSVVRFGNHVRITAQLLEARSDRHLWAKAYDRDAREIMYLQEEVAGNVVHEIQAKLTPQENLNLSRK